MTSLWQRRVLYLAVPIIVVVVFSSVIVAAERQRTPDWDAALRAYLASGTIVQVERADYPWTFAETVTFSPVGHSDFTIRSTAPTLPNDKASTIIKQSRLQNIMPGEPEKIRCIHLLDGDVSHIFLAAYYTDNLWNADWVIYKAMLAASDQQLAADLTTIGCHLDL